MNIQKIVQQLDRKTYSLLLIDLKETKATKFLLLLAAYRKGKEEDQKLFDTLNVLPSAFYTLKSRLLEKVKAFLFQNVNDTRIQLLKNVANVEHLVYKTPRAIAIGLLKKLEVELSNIDMPNELITVYKALKKLHVNSPKYYEYSQLYNKHVAFKLGQDKAEELLSSFCKTLSEYYLYRNDDLFDILVLYKKEMENTCELYNSHYLRVHRNILNIHFALFSPLKTETENDDNIEDMLKEVLVIIESHIEHSVYYYLIKVIDFLYFEYYFQLKLFKNASIYYDRLVIDIPSLLLSSHTSFTPHFLISKIKYDWINNDGENYRYGEANKITDFGTSAEEEESNYIMYNYYKAGLAYYTENYDEGIKVLSKLSSAIYSIDKPFFDVELKVFLALLNCLRGTEVQVDGLVRGAIRKIAMERNDEKFRLLSLFLKLLKVTISPKSKHRYENLVALNRQFNLENTGQYKVLEFITLDDKVIKKLAALK